MIKKLLLLEWKKLSANRTFRIMMGMYAVLLPVVFLVWKFIPNLAGSFNSQAEAVIRELDINPYMFPHVWKSLGYLGNWMNYYLLGIIGILIITNEYDFKTLRQSIINGLTRRDYFLGKTLITLAIAAICTVYFTLIGLVLGFVHTDYVITSKIFQYSDVIFRYALQIVGYMSLAMFFGWLFRRFSLALLFYFVIPIIESILLNYLVYNTRMSAPMYMPLSAMKNLVPVYWPVSQMNAGMTEMAIQYEKEFNVPFFLPETPAIIMTFIYTVLFIGLGYFRFMRSDV